MTRAWARRRRTFLEHTGNKTYPREEERLRASRQAKITPFQLAMLLIPGIGSTAILGLAGEPRPPSPGRTRGWRPSRLSRFGSGHLVGGRLAQGFRTRPSSSTPHSAGQVPGKCRRLPPLLVLFPPRCCDLPGICRFSRRSRASTHTDGAAVLLAGFAAAVAVRHGPEILARLGELFTPGAVSARSLPATALLQHGPPLLKPVLDMGCVQCSPRACSPKPLSDR